MSERDDKNLPEEEDYGPDLVTVADDDGNVHVFEKLDAIETDTGRYVALLPYYENPADSLLDDGELIILEVKEDGDASFLLPIDDEDLYDEIADIFEDRLADYYEIDSE